MTDGNFEIATAAVTDRGLSEKRPQNEDSYLSLPEHGVFAVADGVGGAMAGDVASQMAVEILGEAFINYSVAAEPATNSLLIWLVLARPEHIAQLEYCKRRLLAAFLRQDKMLVLAILGNADHFPCRRRVKTQCHPVTVVRILERSRRTHPVHTPGCVQKRLSKWLHFGFQRTVLFLLHGQVLHVA